MVRYKRSCIEANKRKRSQLDISQHEDSSPPSSPPHPPPAVRRKISRRTSRRSSSSESSDSCEEESEKQNSSKKKKSTTSSSLTSAAHDRAEQLAKSVLEAQAQTIKDLSLAVFKVCFVKLLKLL